jgi:integrase/recombinase XerD
MNDCVELFLNYLATEKGCSQNTLAAYSNDLNQLADFVRARSLERGSRPGWDELNGDMLTTYMLDLKAKKYAPATVARKVATAKSFAACMVSMGRLSCNPTENLASPRVSKALPVPLSVSEVHILLGEPARHNSSEASRDRAMLELLYATGMRVSQMVALNTDDIDSTICAVRCFSRAAGNRSIPITPAVLELVRDYVENARPRLARDEQDALFLNQRGERLTRQGFWLILKGYAERAGLGDKVTPHVLRHTFAVHQLCGGADLHAVQKLLGHTHILSTKVYQQVKTSI